jgi:hypothetical protein
MQSPLPTFKDARAMMHCTLEGARVLAERTGKYAGTRGPFWADRDGTWHDTWPEGGAVAVKVGVCRSDWPDPVWDVVHLEECYRTPPSARHAALFANLAERRALFKAFPSAFADASFTPQDAREGEP